MKEGTITVALVLMMLAGTAHAQGVKPLAKCAPDAGVAGDNYAPCIDSGQNCANDVYAVSLAGVPPSAFVTWFQAQEACANAGKRLPTSAEWQVGANGTPDTGASDNGTTDCNTFSTFAVAATGSRSGCVSARGVFDGPGNLTEWVVDWVPRTTGCPNWGGFSDDAMCISGASTTAFGPGAMLRGGDYNLGAPAGPLAVSSFLEPSASLSLIGFRCAR